MLCHFQYSIIYHTFALGRGVQGSHGLCHFQYCYSHLPHLCYRQGVQEAHVFFATFNIVTVIYRTCAIGRGFRRLMCFATFNIVLVIYRTCAIGRGVQDAHVYCHFFNNVSVLYHTCVVVRAFRRLMCYATNNIQSFITPLL